MRTEYEIWKDELAGKRPALVTPAQWIIFLAGLALFVGVALTRR